MQDVTPTPTQAGLLRFDPYQNRAYNRAYNRAVNTDSVSGLLRFDPYTYTESVFYRLVVRSVVRSVVVRIKPQQAYSVYVYGSNRNKPSRPGAQTICRDAFRSVVQFGV